MGTGAAFEPSQQVKSGGLHRSYSPVSVLDVDVECRDELRPHLYHPADASWCGTAEGAVPTGHPAPSLRQAHLLPEAQSLLTGLSDRQKKEKEQPVAVRVSLGSWTPERRESYRRAADARGAFRCVRPEECASVAASLDAEVDAVVGLLEEQACDALHFCTGGDAISGKHTSEAMLRALSSWRFQDRQSGCLRELGVHGWLASRELCAALPEACRGLQRLLLSGCAARLYLEPLRELSELQELVLQTDIIPDLRALPPSLRRLEIDVVGVGARVRLPARLRLVSLRVSCPHGRVFVSAGTLVRLCREVELECDTVVLQGLADGSNGDDTVNKAGDALVAAVLGQPIQRLHLHARRLAFALPAGSGGKPDSWPKWAHQLRYVGGKSGAGLASVLAAALPHWQQLEAAPLDHAPADSPAVLADGPRGIALCKRNAVSPHHRGIYRLPPLDSLSGDDMRALALLAAPAELHFADGCTASQQAALLRLLHTGGAPVSRLRRLGNCRLSADTDLSAFTCLESVTGVWEGSEAGAAPPARLPAGVRELRLTGAGVLDGSALLAGFTGSLEARGFDALRLPGSAAPLAVDWALGSASAVVGDAMLQLDGIAERLFLRVPPPTAADSLTSPAVVELDGEWLSQTRLAVLDMRSSPVKPSSCASDGGNNDVDASGSSAAPSLRVQLAFAGRTLADLFSGALRSAAAGGLQRLEVLCGGAMQGFSCPALQFTALHGAEKSAFGLSDLLRLPSAQRAGWRVTLAADPWRLVLAHEGSH